ncbi:MULTISPECIES: agmatinase [unclassified Rhizobium]|jgi:agmatinase|uniref:agmatinase n=1 Tax=unclassified Rhizobium TaxID=2613769 RepID=UPI000648994F|nr:MULTISPECIES: agmatinase [unclassified Rhizobium]OJY65572.1 MAG: agmatinase [Rhizobium sp. 60-20]RKD35774.1 agmatinase [Rhizobium sp. WW_1]
MPKYYPVDSLKAPKFCGVRTFMRLPHIQTTEDVDVAFIGIPFDTAGSYRTGQRFGPAAIRNASVMVRAHNPIQEITIFDYISGVDYGDLSVVPGNIEETYRLIEEGLQPILDAGVIPICLGGDHSITLGELRAVAKKYGPVGLVHFDAHADTDDEPFGLKYNHGTPFRWAIKEGLLDVDHSISVGIRGSMYHPNEVKDSEDLGLKVITADKMRQLGMAEVTRQIKERVGDKLVFFTFDIDFIDPAYAPGTGTIEPEGFTSHEALALVRSIKDLNFVAFDVVEMLPEFDPSMITANLASHVGYEFATIVALHKKNGAPYLAKLK